MGARARPTRQCGRRRPDCTGIVIGVIVALIFGGMAIGVLLGDAKSYVVKDPAPTTTEPLADYPVAPTGVDLECYEIGHKVAVGAVGFDPYELDADGDGVGCESYPTS